MDNVWPAGRRVIRPSRRAVTAAIAAAAMGVLAACDTRAGTSTPAGPSRTDTVTAAPTPTALGLGQLHALTGLGEGASTTVTAVHPRTVSTSGKRYYGITIEACVGMTAGGSPTVGGDRWSVLTGAGTTVSPTYDGGVRGRLPAGGVPVPLTGGCRSGVLTFRLPAGARVVAIRYADDAGPVTFRP